MDNRCIYCNEIIPEGRQVCPTCERLQTETTKAERFDRAMKDWVLPLGLVALIVLAIIFLKG